MAKKKNTPSIESTSVRVNESSLDTKLALQSVMHLMAIPGKSGEEAEVAEAISKELLYVGASPDQLFTDNAHKQAIIAGNTGSLILRLPGTIRGPRRLLSAHLDTVPICVGTKPVVDGDFVRSDNPATGLGADNRAGCAVLLQTARTILQQKLPHPPLTFCWFIQEEVGLYGARYLNKALLGKPAMAFNWDGGAPEKLTVGATGGYRMAITIKGLASHAGIAPEKGVSAITIAAVAIADLAANGWLGLVKKGSKTGTSNIGFIHGGEATNVITDHVVLKAEARSHVPAFREKIVANIEKAFQRAAKTVRSSTGKRGSVEIDGRLDYEAFRLDEGSPCVSLAKEAVTAVGRAPVTAISNGGLDANWMNANGIPTVSLGCGQMNVHTTGERLDIAGYYDACRIALRLATET